jgi:beta-glucosidase
MVIMHSVGPALREVCAGRPNVTAVLHANLPSQEMGNAILEIVFVAVNPSRRFLHIIANQRSEYPMNVP